MPKKKPNYEADVNNRNKGTTGTNKAWKDRAKNKGRQFDPMQAPPRQSTPKKRK